MLILKKYIKDYPKGKDVNIAVHLILDSFNQVDNFKGLIREGPLDFVTKESDRYLIEITSSPNCSTGKFREDFGGRLKILTQPHMPQIYLN